jgi:hypothetical protein
MNRGVINACKYWRSMLAKRCPLLPRKPRYVNCKTQQRLLRFCLLFMENRRTSLYSDLPLKLPCKVFLKQGLNAFVVFHTSPIRFCIVVVLFFVPNCVTCTVEYLSYNRTNRVSTKCVLLTISAVVARVSYVYIVSNHCVC